VAAFVVAVKKLILARCLILLQLKEESKMKKMNKKAKDTSKTQNSTSQ